MRKNEGRFLGTFLSVALAACSSSSSTPPLPDAGGAHDSGKPSSDAGKSNDSGKSADTGMTGHDAAVEAHADAPMTTSDAGDAGPKTRHVLVTYNGTANTTTPSTTFAVNLTTKAIDGTINSADSEVISDTSNRLAAPYLLSQTFNVVNRIDPTTWKEDGTWAVPTPDGSFGADPYSVSVSAAGQLYVINYGSNDIDVFDTTTPDGGTPTHVISLASLLQPGDDDGSVDATAGVYDAATKRLYVVLGNVNTSDVFKYMGSYLTACQTTTSSVIAIDTMTNTLVSLGGTAPGGGIALAGFDPSGPAGVVHDVAGNRLLIAEAGCNPAPTSDGGAPGAVKLRGVEQVDLTANTSKILLDASDQGFPGNLVYIDSTHAVLGFIYPVAEVFPWDPTSTTLGTQLMNAPETFDYDGNGNLVGASVVYGDGGTATTNIFSMPLATPNDITVLQSNVIALGEGYVASVGVWPRP